MYLYMSIQTRTQAYISHGVSGGRYPNKNLEAKGVPAAATEAAAAEAEN